MLKFIKVTTDTEPKNIPTIDFLQFQHLVFFFFFFFFFCYFVDEIRDKVPMLLSNTEVIKLYPF